VGKEKKEERWHMDKGKPPKNGVLARITKKSRSTKSKVRRPEKRRGVVRAAEL